MFHLILPQLVWKNMDSVTPLIHSSSDSDYAAIIQGWGKKVAMTDTQPFLTVLTEWDWIFHGSENTHTHIYIYIRCTYLPTIPFHYTTLHNTTQHNITYTVCIYITPGRAAQKGPVLEKNALNRLVHNLLELISKGYNPTDLSQQPSCNFPGKQIKILFHNLYVD